MAAGETKELITYARRGGRVRAGGGGVASEKPQLGSQSSSSRRSLHGFRATKQWVEETALDKGPIANNSSTKKEGRVHFKQENASFSPSPLLRKDVACDAQAALSPISLNSLPGFRPPLSSSKSSALQESDLNDAKILQQAVPCVRNEGGERKVVWCNPAFCADSEDRRFSNDSAAGATPTFTIHRPLSSFSKTGDVGVVSQDLPDPPPPSEQVGRRSIANGPEEEDPASSSGLSKVDAQSGNYGSPEKGTSSGSPTFSISAVVGSSPATVTTSSTPEKKGRSLLAHFELESASGNWYTPVMSSLTPESVRMMDVSRTRKTLAQMPAFKAASSSQAFFSSPAHPLCGAAASATATATAASPSMRDDTPGDSNRRRPSGAYKLDAATTSEYYGGSERRSSRILSMQQVIVASANCSDGKSHRDGNRAGGPSTGRVDVTSSGAQKGQGLLLPALQNGHEAMVEDDLEAEISREIEEEIAKEILILSTKLAQLHARQEMRRAAWGEKSKVGHSCPQTPLRCAPSPAEPTSASPAAALSAVQEEKQRPASESKRRSGRVVAAKFLQSATERSKGVQSVDRSSRRRLVSDAPFLGPINLPRRSLGTPARLLVKSKSARSSCSPEQHHHCQLEQGMKPRSRSKVSAEEYVRERSSSAAGMSKSKKAVVKEVSRKDLEESRIVDTASMNMERQQQQQQHARSLSMGSAVQSRYFPEFERKIDWVKTLRSEALPSTTAVPMNSMGQLVDDLIPKQICKDTQDIHAWLRENHGSLGIKESSSEETIEPEAIHPALASPIPVERCDQSNDNTPQLDRRPASQRQQGRTSAPASFVARNPTPTKASRPWTTPTRNTPSSAAAAAAARSCSPSVRSRTVPSRYGTPVKSIPQSPGTNDKCVTDPKLVLESPVRKSNQTPRNDHTLRRASVSKEPGVSPGPRGRSLVRKPTIRKGYPGVAGWKSKAEGGAGGCGGDVDAHCSRHHHQQPSPGKTRDRKSLGSSGGNDCMKPKDNFEAEYEKFVESSEVVDKQVSELMENVSTSESSAEVKAADPPNGNFAPAQTAAAKHTYIRCVDLIKDDSSNLFVLQGRRATTGQSVLPPTDGQDSDDSVLARSIPRTESSADVTSEERSADGQQNVEVKLAGDLTAAVPSQGSRIDITNDGLVETQLWCEDTLMIERKSLPKVIARTGGVQDDDYERDSGSVRRIYDQQLREDQTFSLISRDLPPWSDNEGLSPDEIEGQDLESFWCLVGELKGPIMITRP